MKESTIETNAYDGNYKTYTELINRLEEVKDAIKKHNYGIAMDVLCKPYPEFQITTQSELEESEDEKVRNTLHEYFKECKNDGDIDETWHGVSYDKILAWLEKQCRQKEINLVEILKHYPKETELYSPLYGKLWLAEVDEKNEIITCYKHPLDEGCTRAVLEQEDTVSFYSNGTTGLPDFNVSKDCMLFLYDIEKQGENVYNDELSKLLHEVICHFINNPNIPYSKREEVSKKIIPYIEKLENQGDQRQDVYTQINPSEYINNMGGNGCYLKNTKQQLAWCEEDENIKQSIINILTRQGYQTQINWFKSIKDRIQLQNSSVTDEELAQAKKDAYNNALDKIEYHSGEPTFDDGWSAAIWYLKKRNARPQTTWKPSDLQIEALESATANCAYSEYEDCLTDLIEQLKKLKG